MEACAEDKAKNAMLEKKIRELSAENKRLRSEKYSAESSSREIKVEKDRLLKIIENLSKGFAQLKVEVE